MITRTLLNDILTDADIDDDAVRYDYSGRGMYGITCLGLMGDHSTLLAFVAELARRQAEFDATGDDDVAPDLFDALNIVVSNVAVDQMGHDLIFYWPRLVVVDE